MKTELTKIAATMQTLTSTLLVLAGRVAEPHREDAPEPCPLCGTEMPVDSQTHTAASGDECEGVCPDCSCPVSYDDALERYLHVDDHATCFMQQTSTDLLRNDVYHRDDRIQRRVVNLVHALKDGTAVDGWTANTDYMVGTLYWVHPSLPDLAFYATPNWERNDSISGDYVSYAAQRYDGRPDSGLVRAGRPHEPESLFGEVKVEDGGWPEGDPETLAAYMAIVRPLLAKVWAHYNPPPSAYAAHCDEYYFDGEHDGFRFRDIDAFLSANADDFSPEMVAKIRGLEPGGLVNIPIHMGYAILRRGDRVACDGCGSLVPASEVETHGGGDPLCKDCFDKTEAEFDRGHAEDEAAIAAHAVNARQTAFGAYRSASEKDTDTWTCRCGQSLPLTEAYCPCGLQEREGEDETNDWHCADCGVLTPGDVRECLVCGNPPPSVDGFHCHGCNAHHGDEVAMGLDGNGHTYCYPSTTLLDLFPCQHCRILVPCTEALGHTGSEKYPETEYFCPDCFGEHSVLMTDDDMPLPGDEPVALWLSEDDIQTLLFACTDSVNVMERLLVEVGMEDDRATRTPAEIDDVKRLRDQILALKVTR